ncbi:hypothetical protein UlMin_000255 [Ulmus minor]
MDRYQRVEKPRANMMQIEELGIWITSQGRIQNYITYAMTLLHIVFKEMGRAINKTVTTVELIKRRIVGLHQNTVIGSTYITDTWEPLEEGFLPLEMTRHVSMIVITLSKLDLNKLSPGGRGHGRGDREGQGYGRLILGQSFGSFESAREGRKGEKIEDLQLEAGRHKVDYYRSSHPLVI